MRRRQPRYAHVTRFMPTTHSLPVPCYPTFRDGIPKGLKEDDHPPQPVQAADV